MICRFGLFCFGFFCGSTMNYELQHCLSVAKNNNDKNFQNAFHTYWHKTIRLRHVMDIEKKDSFYRFRLNDADESLVIVDFASHFGLDLTRSQRRNWNTCARYILRNFKTKHS